MTEDPRTAFIGRRCAVEKAGILWAVEVVAVDRTGRYAQVAGGAAFGRPRWVALSEVMLK